MVILGEGKRFFFLQVYFSVFHIEHFCSHCKFRVAINRAAVRVGRGTLGGWRLQGSPEPAGGENKG